MNHLVNKNIKARKRLFFHQPKIRCQYETANLLRAFDATQNGTSVYRASRLYGIPESTLRDRTLGNVPVNAGPGIDKLFSEKEENQLVEHIKYMANIGYGYSKTNVQYLAADFAFHCGKKSSKERPLSYNWFYGLLRRWPDLKVAKPQKLSLLRAQHASKDVMAAYFKELCTILTVNDLHDKPERIFNMDETGINTEHAPPKIVCDSTTKPQAVTSPRSSTVTIIGGGNAVGNHIPPYFVFPGKRWYDILLEGAPADSSGAMLDSGWSNSEVFHTYITTHFAKHAGLSQGKQSPKTLILFDGHKSHISLTLVDWAKDHNVILFVLPPHTSHLTQPLDVAVFGPFKSLYSKACQLYMQSNPGMKITRYEVAKLAAKPYLKAMSSENLTSAFRKYGIYPYSNQAIVDSDVAPSSIYQVDDSDKENTSVQEIRQVGPEKTSPPQRLSSSLASGSQFFLSRTITNVCSKRRKKFVPPFLSGNLSKASNLKNMKLSAPKKLTSKSSKSSVLPETSDRCKEIMPVVTSSTKPGPSAYVVDSPVHSEISSDMSDEDSESETCCMCKKFSPPALRSCTNLVIVKWAQCDKCNHWTHLSFCTTVTCVRRHAEFLCPHCQ